MKRLTLGFTLALLACLIGPRALAQDCGGCKDYPGVARMPGYHLSNVQESQFDAYQFPVGLVGEEVKTQTVEGHLYTLDYDYDEGKTKASPRQIMRNYQNAVRQAKGQALWEDFRDPGTQAATMRFNKGPSEVWMQVTTRGGGNVYRLKIVERQAMQQDVTLDAKAMGDALATTGHVEVPGIYFDFNKSVVKPESDPALKQIAELLRTKPSLKVWVVGHTDAVGTVEANLTLSRARAAAVIAALKQKYGVDAGRLGAFGAGPYAPVASNETEEGRAHNRRVELVGHS